MNQIKFNKKLVISLILIGIILLSYTTTATFSIIEEKNLNETNSTNLSENLPYEGNLRIYIVEPESRWNNYDNEPYHYGFLDYAFNDKISINYLETYDDTIIWNGNQNGYGDIQDDNIIVLAAIFNPEINIAYSRPPIQDKFESHFVDAAAGAKPGETDSNIKNDNFTHSVFIEEATATWCPYCPAMANALNNIYISENYPFYFVALIDDKSSDASARIRNDLNIYGFPSSFFDGGDNVIVGGVTNENTYITKILNTGQRDVHDLDFTLSVEWMGNSELKIDIKITNNEEFFNSPPEKPTIEGSTTGSIGEEYTYVATATDPDENDLYYQIDWGNGTIETKGPYKSGNTVNIKHTWNQRGTYIIRIRSRDTYDEKSDWTTLEVSMPKKQLSNHMITFLNNHPRLQQFFKIYLNFK
jgi:hypothetical protein